MTNVSHIDFVSQLLYDKAINDFMVLSCSG
jgi:hypothetical protein